MIRTVARFALPWAVGLFLACCIVQVFLAGLGVFDDPAAFVTHREFSYMFGWLTLAILVLALAGRQPRRIVGLSALLLGQFALQSILVELRTTVPVVAALHPLNGFAILGVAVVELRASRAVVREMRAGRAEAGAPARTVQGEAA